MGRLRNELESFTRDVIPQNCSEVQYTEMRRAFMGGASSMLAIMGELTSVGREQAFQEIEKLMDELGEFLDAVQKGEA